MTASALECVAAVVPLDPRTPPVRFAAPVAADFPVYGEVIYGDSYDPVGPFGARGAGEAPAAAAGPAIAQAVYNAIGIWVDMPMTPENVITALHRDSDNPDTRRL